MALHTLTNRRITAVTATDPILPVTLDEAKSHLRIAHPDLDALVGQKLQAAVESVEADTGRSLRTSTTITQKYASWPQSPVTLDRQPAKSVTSIAYFDADGNSQTVSSAEYRLHTTETAAAYIEWDDSFTSPTTDCRDDVITITYVAGYASIATVPAMAKEAVKLKLSELFGNLDPRAMESTVRSYGALIAQLGWGCYR